MVVTLAPFVVTAVVALVLLTVFGIVAAFRRTRRLQQVFLVAVRNLGLALRPADGPFTGPVAFGTVSGRPVEIGPVRHGPSGDTMAFTRFRVAPQRPLPAGVYVHTQTFRYNDAGPRTRATPAYDGRYDDPTARSLIGSVPEVVLGDPALDRALVIQARDEVGVRRLLTGADVRGAVLGIASSGDHFRINEHAVEIDVDPVELVDQDAYERRLLRLLGLVHALARA